jgi:hypothetical protein
MAPVAEKLQQAPERKKTTVISRKINTHHLNRKYH